MSKQPSSTAKEQSVSLNVELMPTGHKRRMFFNRFHLLRIDGHVIAYFGLVDDVHTLRDVYACVLTRQTLDNSNEGLTAFLAKVGPPKAQLQPWAPPVSVLETEMPNIISVGQSIDAEIQLASFAVGPAISRSKKNSSPIQTDPVALLRCDLLEFVRLG